MLIQGGTILTEGRRFVADLRIEDGKLIQVGPELVPMPGEEIREAQGRYVAPGFIDIHTHGGCNVDANDATPQDLETISTFFAAHGCTAWNCSILTDTVEKTLWCIRQVREYCSAPHPGAQLMGIHLEGPFLSQEYRGSMPPSLLLDGVDLGLLKQYQEAAGGLIRYITISPELPGAVEAIPDILRLGIQVAIGHSGADYDTAMAAIEAGARAATHTMNAMQLLHQHRPAITGAVLESDVYCEAICDGRHLHPGTVRLLLKTKGLDRVVAITDSIMAAGLPDGRYRLGVNDVTVEAGDAKVTGTDIRAGSTLTMDRALQNLVAFTNRPVEALVPLLTLNPARLLGLSQKGRIQTGMDADLVLLDETLTVCGVCVAGEWQK